MTRRFTGGPLIIASHNAGKVCEIDKLLRPFGVTTRSAVELDLVEPDETGNTFTENALLKAEAAATEAKQPALADDSGLAIDALGGAPGIYSARYAGAKASDTDNVYKLLRNLEGISESKRQARFRCVLCLIDKDGGIYYFEGACEGNICRKPKGRSGFGYDPIFIPERYESSFAELGESIKSKLSHRAKAVIACKQFFKNKL